MSEHLGKNGFVPDYTVWFHHGEHVRARKEVLRPKHSKPNLHVLNTAMPDSRPISEEAIAALRGPESPGSTTLNQAFGAGIPASQSPVTPHNDGPSTSRR